MAGQNNVLCIGVELAHEIQDQPVSRCFVEEVPFLAASGFLIKTQGECTYRCPVVVQPVWKLRGKILKRLRKTAMAIFRIHTAWLQRVGEGQQQPRLGNCTDLFMRPDDPLKKCGA